MRSDWLAHLRDTVDEIDGSTLTEAVRRRDVHGVLGAIPFEEVLEARFGEKVQRRLGDLVFEAAEASRSELARVISQGIRPDRFAATVAVPIRGPEGGKAVVPTLDRTNPEAVRWIELHGAELVREITEETRLSIRELVRRSFTEGIPPRDLARLIREEIGLTMRMGLAVERQMARLFEAGWTAGAIAEARDRMTNRLRRWRAMNIARTETIRASNMGQQLLWMQAVDEGLLDRDRIKRVWITTPDDRLCPFCAAMEGQAVELEGEFESGAVGGRQLPSTLTPPLHPMCRCAMGLQVAEPVSRPTAPTAKPEAKKLSIVEKIHQVIGSGGLVDEVHTRRVGSLVREHVNRKIGGKARKIEKRIREVEKERKAMDRLYSSLFDQKAGLRDERRALTARLERPDLRPEEREIIAQRITKIDAETNELIRQENALKATITNLEVENLTLDEQKRYLVRDAIRKLLSQVRPTGGVTGRWTPGTNAIVSELFDKDIAKWYPTEWLEQSRRASLGLNGLGQHSVHGVSSNRGFYNHYNQEIFIGAIRQGESYKTLGEWRKKDLLGTAFHEYGHRFEHVLNDIRSLERDWYARRTAGESLIHMGWGYDPWEMTRKDKFVHPYIGKDYNGRAFEIVSMGFEELMGGEKSFGIWEKDPEMAEFILGILMGAK